MGRVHRDRVGQAMRLSTPVAIFIILSMFIFAISPITLLLELYFQNKLLKIKWRIKDIVWALNSTFSFWIFIIGLLAICIYRIFNRSMPSINMPTINDYMPLIIVILLLVPHFYFSIKYYSKFNRFFRLKAVGRRKELRAKAEMILKKEKEEDRLKREINKTAR